jgi:hypothetical protein
MGLINARRYGEAVALDRRFIRRSPDPESLLDDGGFELEQSDYQLHATPFDWAIDPRSAEVEQAEGRHYLVVFAAESPDPALQRFLALPSGPYRIAFLVTGPPDSGETLRFAAECAASGTTIGSSPDLPLGDQGRNGLAFEFSVPNNCGLVKLALKRTKPGSSDALIDDISLQRTSG